MSLYLPSRFAAPDSLPLEEVVREHPFATLITGDSVSHVPLVLEVRGPDWVLIGHFARANPHWRALAGGESLAIFHGPQCYVTPTWYESHDVPTWNYVVVHLRGRARLLESEAETERALRVLKARMEPPGGWDFAIPADLAEPGVLLRSIVGFEIPVSKREGKFKLSQNRAPGDVSGVLRGLATRQDESSRGVRRWMERFLQKE